MENQKDNYFNNQPMSKVFIAAWLTLLIIVAIYVRIHGVGDYSYSEDELLHMGMVQAGSLKQVLKFSIYETHPPLGNILRYYWAAFSDSVWFSRSFSLIFGIALIPLYYRIGKVLGGELAGICCAAFMAFSYGCIIQSYVARNYTAFLFFLSASIYCYLLWQRRRSLKNLLLYGGFGILACLTHFFGIFVIFCIAAYETLGFLRLSTNKHTIKGWIIINSIIGCLSIITYFIWKKTLSLAHPYSRFNASDWKTLAYNTFYFPLSAIDYVLPSIWMSYIIVALLYLNIGSYSKALRNFTILTAIAIGIDITMIDTIHYSSNGTRHDLWLAPFLLILSGLVVSNTCNMLANKFPQISAKIPYITAIILTLAGIVSYSPEGRFSDAGEYDIKFRDAGLLAGYLSKLDKKTVIIAERDEAFRIKNIYPYLGEDAFTGKSMATMTSYYDTSIIFNPYYRRMRTKDILFKTMEEARNRNMLEGIDTLVFMHSYPMAVLAACPALEKNILTFPSFGIDHKFTPEEIFSIPAILMIIPKNVFFEQVISPSGKAHGCLTENSYLENYVEPSGENPL